MMMPHGQGLLANVMLAMMLVAVSAAPMHLSAQRFHPAAQRND
jgi:hypothetical protein